MSPSFFLCFFDEFFGTFRAADFNFSASTGNPDFLPAGWAFEMLVSFALVKIRLEADPPIFRLIPEVHELLVFGAAFSDIFGKGAEKSNSVKNKRDEIEKF